MKKLWLLVFLLVALVMVFSACNPSAAEVSPATSDDTSPTETSAQDDPNASEQAWAPTFACDVQVLPLPAVEQPDNVLEVLDGSGQLILFAEQTPTYGADGLFSAYQTQRIGIFDVSENQVVVSWEPQEDGWCCGGALESEQTAVCILRQSEASQQDALYALGESQRCLLREDGELQFVKSAENGKIWLSFADHDGSFGIGSVQNGTYDTYATWQAADGTESLGGLLAVYDDTVGYYGAENGNGTIMIGDPSGITTRYPLEYETERMDSFCMTSNGVLACLSVGEGTKDAHRELVLWNADGTQTVLRRAASGALYQMCYAKSFGVCVDSNWRVHILSTAEGQIFESTMQDVLPDDLMEEAVWFCAADDFSFYFYYPYANQLLRVTVSPSA
jgi:hypothetical protein